MAHKTIALTTELRELLGNFFGLGRQRCRAGQFSARKPASPLWICGASRGKNPLGFPPWAVRCAARPKRRETCACSLPGAHVRHTPDEATSSDETSGVKFSPPARGAVPGSLSALGIKFWARAYSSGGIRPKLRRAGRLRCRRLASFGAWPWRGVRPRLAAHLIIASTTGAEGALG